MASGKGNGSKNVKAAANEEKIVTRYDRKVQRRKEEERKAKRDRKIAIIVAAALAVVVVISSVVALWTNYDKVHNEYISVDGEKVSEIEFDFYYALNKQATLSQTLYGDMTYESYFTSYMGYDSSKDDSQQTYASTDNTWYDYFADATVTAIKEYKALNKAANEAGFTYDNGDDDYQSFVDSITTAADNEGISVSEYYKDVFGRHATEDNLKGYIYTYLKAAAYQEQLQTDLAATESEISDYYNENKDNYDTVTYRSFAIAAETAGDETAMASAKAKADSMAASVVSEETFIALCQSNASDDQKETYADESASLSSEQNKTAAPAAIADWLFDSARTEANVTVVEDTENSQYYVVYFISRQYDSSNDTNIAATVLSNKYSELITGYTSAMAVDNKKNRIKMYTE